MTKPPINKVSQKDYVHSAVRFPPELRDELRSAAERNGRSFNAEVLSRLHAQPTDAVLAELADLKRLVRQILDQM